ARDVGGLAGLSAERAAPDGDGGDRARGQGACHPVRARAHRPPARHPSRGRDRDRARSHHADRPRTGGALDPAAAAGRGQRAHARRFGICAGRHPARAVDDDYPHQCGEPDRRLHVARERVGAGRDRLARHGAGGGGFGRLLDPDRVRGVRDLRVSHPRAFRQRRCRRHRPFPRRTEGAPVILPVDALLIIPAVAVPILALVSNYRLGAALNVIASGASLAAGIALLFSVRVRSDLIIVDDFNVYLITLTTLIGFTTSVFSASYIAHEIDIGRLTPAFLRFYHAMYQALLGAM